MRALAIIGCTVGGGFVGMCIGVMTAKEGYMDFSAAFNAAAGAVIGGIAGVVVGSVVFAQ